MSTEINVSIKQDFINLKPQKLPPDTQSEGIVFLNELDKQPKFRAPNNGLIYNLNLSRYIGKNCVYQEPDDTNGLFYWFLSDFGAQPWSYSFPSTINIESSSTLASGFDNFFPSLYLREPSTYTTDDLAFSSLTIVFNFPEKFYPSGIYLKSPNVDTYGFIQSYKIYFTNPDSEAYFGNYEFINSNDLVGVGNSKYISFTDTDQYCTRITILQMGLNSAGTNHLALGQLELYGKFI